MRLLVVARSPVFDLARPCSVPTVMDVILVGLPRGIDAAGLIQVFDGLFLQADLDVGPLGPGVSVQKAGLHSFLMA